ncbi:MAG: GH3 auxin-responsive promoter family protein [Chitinophagaceae bacterium]
MNLLRQIVSLIFRKKYNQIKHWKNYPHKMQKAIFQNLIHSGQYTEFGKQYHFSKINQIKDFQEQVPLHEYETIKPYIDKMMEGEENVLWNTPIYWFSKSSGTTSGISKYIPVSEETLSECHYLAAKEVVSVYQHHFKNNQLLSGKTLVLGGSHQVIHHNEDIHVGDVSAVLLENAPFYSNLIQCPPSPIALMIEWEKKIEKMAEYALKEKITAFAGVPTWTLILMKKILDISGKKYLIDAIPHLEAYIHGGVSFVPYKHTFNELIGKTINYVETYNASEGFFAMQDNFKEDEGILLAVNHGIFYEFLPIDEYQQDNPKTYTLEEVELHKQYALVITTNSGLWRYIIGDTITFTNLRPYSIKVSGRLKQFINAVGEEVIVENADKAIQYAAQQTHTQIKDYTAAPIYITGREKGRHEWIIEFEIPPQNIDYFIELLDNKLQSENSDYEAKRYKNMALLKPLVHVAKKGLFEAWLRKNNKLGGQNKIPRLSNDRKYINELLVIRENIPL